MMNQQSLIILLLSIVLIACDPVRPLLLPETAISQVVNNETSTSEDTLIQKSSAIKHPAELITSFTQPPQSNGEVLILYGQVLDVNGNPIPNVVVEIWQTDVNGIYNHPGDRKTNDRDITFQFYGTAMVNKEGWYTFRTILPGEYNPRPRHIHFKVKQNSITLLTSQFYFSDDIAKVQGEGMFLAVGEGSNSLLLQLVQDDETLLANGQIVVDTGIGSGTMPLTPSQAEGPFYPIATLADYDNDLTTLP